MMPPLFHALQCGEKFVRCHLRDRTFADVAVEQVEKPSRLLDRRGRFSFVLYLLDIFLGDQPEGGTRGDLGRQLALLLLLDRIDAVDKLGARFVA